MHGLAATCKPHGGSRRRRRSSMPRHALVTSSFMMPAKRSGTRMPKLFSYGTLQQADVQIATFGRRLTGVSDALVGYRQSMVAIDDPDVVRTSGKTHHPIVAFTGASEDRVPGAVFDISD